MRTADPLPAELQRLAPRQRDVVRVIYAQGGATAREIYARIPEPPAFDAGLRTILRRLMQRGILRRRPCGTHAENLYLPVITNADLQRRAFARIAELHFAGSKARALEALVELAANERREERAA